MVGPVLECNYFCVKETNTAVVVGGTESDIEREREREREILFSLNNI